MVISLNLKIKEVEKEIDEKNFEKALGLLDEIAENDEDYELSLLFRVSCLINLKRYEECLLVIDVLLRNNPHEELLWADKVVCHYFSDEKDMALKSLGKLEGIVNRNDAYSLYIVSQLANLVNQSDKAIEYADLALQIDEEFESAIIEKAHAASRIKNREMMNECADRLIKLYGEGELLKMTFPFMLKLFSGNYVGCLDIVNGIDDSDGKMTEMLKYAIYNQMGEELNVEIYATGPFGSDLDDALKVLFDYYYDGIEGGMIGGVSYVIVKKS